MQFAVKDIEHDSEAQIHDCYVAMEVLREVLVDNEKTVIHFPYFELLRILELHFAYHDCRSWSLGNRLLYTFLNSPSGYPRQFQSQI